MSPVLKVWDGTNFVSVSGGPPGSKGDTGAAGPAGDASLGKFDAYDSTGGQAVAGSAVVLDIDTVRLNTNASIFSFSAGVLTVTLEGDGVIEIGVRGALGNTGVDDYGFRIPLERAPAATGVFEEVPGLNLPG